MVGVSTRRVFLLPLRVLMANRRAGESKMPYSIQKEVAGTMEVPRRCVHPAIVIASLAALLSRPLTVPQPQKRHRILLW